MKNERPIDEVRLGKIKAAIWRNDGSSGIWFNVTVSRLYNDGDGAADLKQAQSFGRDDLPLVGKVLDQAHTRIFELQAAEREREGPTA